MKINKLIILFSKRRRTEYLSHRRFFMFSGGKKSRFETLTKESETKPYKFMRERERERERETFEIRGAVRNESRRLGDIGAESGRVFERFLGGNLGVGGL